MITREIAVRGIQAWLDGLGPEYGGWVVIEEMTLEKPYGWMIYKATREYLATGNPLKMPAGNSALICFRESGEFLAVGTAMRSKEYLDEYEEDPVGFRERYRVIGRVGRGGAVGILTRHTGRLKRRTGQERRFDEIDRTGDRRAMLGQG